MQNVVGFALINSRHEILLQLREDKPALPYPGYWVIPGGAIDEGESPDEAVIREIEEEFGIQVEKKRLSFLGAYAGKPDFNVAFIYAYTTPDGIALKNLEGEATKYFTFGEMIKLALGFNQNERLIPLIKKHLAPVIT